ncbi:tetratricopeptide repeat protein [Phaeobacter gallaeciensis]|uniref:TPR repeat protein n=1 Tax=Phaeobacter gallaeciensis TaxID=60890 RepID=A0AAD0EE32_9RHOB|nr:tetratricopeptide repeat protein [Phaeobacter gallaeciensis]AHD10629.1 TPR repeat protein [Phaeobacter gallaeciensis DSM 26640]ATE93892.1 TPR repeat protein [Phaeobacter gallaeciensis]ATE96287.1 TPR repeat protein [Phaeobacter gallaeciensis]ATF02556.1 TPR repeat protein [Phaeobacter gallaeciensis]ATF06936.1 TPR repeat protein [Phaeobacter gallaeciensis]
MMTLGWGIPSRLCRLITATLALALVAACVSPGGKPDPNDPLGGPALPGVDPRGIAESGLIVGHRLMAAAEYELALDAFTRAALEDGLTAEVLSGLGTANLGLGRLGQAETHLRRAVERDPDWPAAMNNLGVVLMERQKYPEAEQILRRAFALDNGESDAIRENFRLALAKLDQSTHSDPQQKGYALVQRGGGSYLIRTSR